MLPGTLVLALLIISAVQSKAQIYDISAANASLQINLSSPNAGLSDWMLNGVNQLQQQWFYYSIGSGPVESIDTISPWTTPTLTSSSLSETYSGSSLKVTAGFSLGPGSGGASVLTDSLSLQNLSGITQTFYFYQYSDFILGGSSGGQNVQFTQTGPAYNMTQTATGGRLTGDLSALGGGGLATVEEIAGINNGMQFGITNGNPTAPQFNDTSLSASGSVDFAYEFSATLTPNSSITISEFQTAVPEPASLPLISSGILALAVFYRCRLAFFKKFQKKS